MKKSTRRQKAPSSDRFIAPDVTIGEGRILILAPTGNDAGLTADFLAQSHFVSHICRDVEELCAELDGGCGAVLLAEETLAENSIMDLVETLSHQPAWSDIPVVIITSSGEASQMQLRRLGLFGSTGNVSLLERPFRPGTLISIIQSASHARRRQYEVRGLLQVVSESERRYRELVKGLPAAVYTTDAEGRINLYNEAALKLWGREPEIGKDLWNGTYRIFRSDGTPMAKDEFPMAIALKERRPVRGQEIIIERPDGTRRIVVPHPDPIFNDAGELVGGVNMLLDVTDSIRAEENSRRLAAIVEFSEDAIASKDINGIIKSWNRGAERLFGYQSEEIIGKPVSILMSPDLWSEEAKILERIRRGEHLEHYETVRQRKDGSKVDVSLTISPIKDANGKVIGASKIVRDITGQKQAKRDLERAHKELLAASSAKDDFIAALSHELRTPLNPVLLLASEAAEDPQIPAPIREMFNQIRNNVELEARLIDDLLDITRISRGKLSLHLNHVDAHSVLRDAIATIQSDIDEKRIVFTLTLSATQHTLRADPVRLQQVFWNILKNAAKFTPDFGKIDVSTGNYANGEFELSVTDSGIGMTESELARIFGAFAQGEHAKASGGHRFGGLGLGLAICRTLVESHSGSIRADSKGRNQGSTFIVTLPTVKKEVAGMPPLELAHGNGTAAKTAPNSLHILLVEDHEPTRRALAQLLTRRHHDVKMAGSVAEARELFGHNDFQLLISDIGLPDGSGFDLMKELHARDKNLRGIALTGYGMEQDVERSEEAGFISHLTKPIRVQSLDLILATLGDN